jgi:type IV pilus assembly protein PilC
VLDRVAFQIEKETQIKRRVKGAMMYPTMVLIFATLVLIGLLMFLVPVFVNIFAQLGGELPKLTQIVVAASNQLRHTGSSSSPRWRLDLGVPRAKRTETGRGSGTGSS